ncbi:uncharacterized protein G2W53_042988 [Senna tora]|uniref:Uncharacterized protein n=1 Tax=Senna tora TaxID=362788 RepID=A0A834SHU8_9FABA|nr:uncharacterized protein G2W53_042988 [Senna tora]
MAGPGDFGGDALPVLVAGRGRRRQEWGKFLPMAGPGDFGGDALPVLVAGAIPNEE